MKADNSNQLAYQLKRNESLTRAELPITFSCVHEYPLRRSRFVRIIGHVADSVLFLKHKQPGEYKVLLYDRPSQRSKQSAASWPARLPYSSGVTVVCSDTNEPALVDARA